MDRAGRVMRSLGHVVLAVVAVSGAVLSYDTLRRAAEPFFGVLAYGFPVLVDFLILGASLQYVAGIRIGRPHHLWRVTAHAGIAGTIALNAMAATSIGGVPWHVVAPAVWAVLVELYARQFAGEYKATHAPSGRIPLRLWLTAPAESFRAWLHQARRVADVQARRAVGVHGAARVALREATRGQPPTGRRVRRVLGRQLRTGALDPEVVLAACGWTGDASGVAGPAEVLRRALVAVLDATPAQRDATPAQRDATPAVALATPAQRDATPAVALATAEASRTTLRIVPPLPKRIEALRTQRPELSNAAIARELGVNPSTVSRALRKEKEQ